MPHFETRRRVAYTPDEMYRLVADVERYPEFLPLCEGLRVQTRKPLGDGGEEIVAEMLVGYQLIRERFTSRVVLDPTKPIVTADLVDGPFERLHNRWRFDPVGAGCEVTFTIDYTFKSRLLQMLVGTMFDTAFRRFTEAFEARARTVYGPRPSA